MLLRLQPQTSGCGVHEATQQGGEHRAGHRQGRHADPGGEGLLQTDGESPNLNHADEESSVRDASSG